MWRILSEERVQDDEKRGNASYRFFAHPVENKQWKVRACLEILLVCWRRRSNEKKRRLIELIRTLGSSQFQGANIFTAKIRSEMESQRERGEGLKERIRFELPQIEDLSNLRRSQSPCDFTGRWIPIIVDFFQLKRRVRVTLFRERRDRSLLFQGLIRWQFDWDVGICLGSPMLLHWLNTSSEFELPYRTAVHPTRRKRSFRWEMNLSLSLPSVFLPDWIHISAELFPTSGRFRWSMR